MIISFDLDDTLFVSEDKFDVEKPLPFPFNLERVNINIYKSA